MFGQLKQKQHLRSRWILKLEMLNSFSETKTYFSKQSFDLVFRLPVLKKVVTITNFLPLLLQLILGLYFSNNLVDVWEYTTWSRFGNKNTYIGIVTQTMPRVRSFPDKLPFLLVPIILVGTKANHHTNLAEKTVTRLHKTYHFILPHQEAIAPRNPNTFIKIIHSLIK